MEIAQLETFLQVAEHGSLSRAAEVLGLTQPTLSARVQALERDLGHQLFERRGRGLRLTEAGRALLPYAERTLLAMREGREAVSLSGHPSRGRLRIGTARVIGAYALPGILAGFRAEYPGIELTILTGRSHEVLQMVLNQEVHVGLGRALSHPEVEAVYLYEEEIVFVTHPDHPLARRGSAAISEIALEPLILYDKDSTYYVLITRVCREAGILPRVTMNLDSVEATKKMIEGGLGVSFLPYSAIQSELATGTLVWVPLSEGHMVTLPTSAMVLKTSLGNPVVETFLGALRGYHHPSPAQHQEVT